MASNPCLNVRDTIFSTFEGNNNLRCFFFGDQKHILVNSNIFVEWIKRRYGWGQNVTSTCCYVEINAILCTQYSVMSETEAMQVLHIFIITKKKLENQIMKAPLTITSTSKDRIIWCKTKFGYKKHALTSLHG